MLVEGVGADWEDMIESYAYHFANETRIPQVVWFNAIVDAYGRSPLPEWNQKHARRASLRVVKVIQPKGTT